MMYNKIIIWHYLLMYFKSHSVPSQAVYLLSESFQFCTYKAYKLFDSRKL